MQTLLRVTRRATLIAAVGAAMIVGAPTGALAADDSDAVQTAAAVASAVDATPAADAGTSVSGASTAASAVVAEVSGNQVNVPRDPQQGVALGGADGGPSVTLGLPANNLTTDATVISSTVVYTQPGGQNSIAVQPLSDGSLRAAVSMADSTAPKDYSYALTLPDGVLPVLNDAGGIDFVRTISADGAVTEAVVGGLATPWATDANGNPVPTSYTVDGNTVTQHIDFGSDSAFPIVADPRVVWHWYGPGLKFNRTETGRARNRGVLLSMLAGFCWAAGPETLGAACGVGAVEAGGIAAVASNAYGDRKCLEMLWGWMPRETGC